MKKVRAELRSVDKLIVLKSKKGRGNQGNVSRAFFKEANHAAVAKVLRISKSIVENVATLIYAINSKRRFDEDAYCRVAKDVYDEYVRLAPRFWMSPGLHILLIHVPQMQRLLDYPISMTSEESTESINKVIRKALRDHVRATSSEMVNRTLMKYLYVCSDPKIVRKCHFADPKKLPIPHFALRLYPNGVEDPVAEPVADGWERIDEGEGNSELENSFRRRLRNLSLSG